MHYAALQLALQPCLQELEALIRAHGLCNMVEAENGKAAGSIFGSGAPHSEGETHRVLRDDPCDSKENLVLGNSMRCN